MAGFKDYATICASAPSEYLAALALRQGETLVARNRDINAENLALLDGFFERQVERLAFTRPKAGPIAFPRLEQGVGATEFCQRLRAAQGALLAPSPLFDAGDAHFRLGFGRSNFPAGLEKLGAYLDNGGATR